MVQDQQINPITIEDKMRNSYLNYSLSVIIGRALPDVRDGLKPVHRRILYATKKLGLIPDKPHKKSARIVGEVLGKYHPHGDQAVYNAMVRMAQDFSQRYKLIDGHGNFGSVDGDSAAAMRYTEARLASISLELLKDIEEDTINFVDNFDGTLEEPTVLPSRVPNLLVNGSSGIAVGMSTNIPPHNLSEVIDGLTQLLENPDLEIDKLIETIPGPDFPTGGEIVGNKGIKKAYKTGKGKVTLRGKSTVEDRSRGRKRVVITEIPYQLNKTKLIKEIADTVKKNKINNVSDVRDESDREGLRIVIDLKRKADPDIILNRLYKYTSLQSKIRINMLALINQQPQVMDLKTILQHFIDFRKEVVTRRTKHQLKETKDKQHILLGLKKAIDNLDIVIDIIRNSESSKKAKKNLQRKLEVTKRQAKAILNMKLQRLVSLEIDKLETELQELKEKIDSLEAILNNEAKLIKLIKEELIKVKEEYGDQRKTKIIEDDSEAKLNKKDLIKDKEAVISLSYNHKLKRTDDKENVRAGKNDYITQVLSGRSHNKLLFFTQTGQVHLLKIHKIPEHHSLSTGDHLSEFIKFPLDEKIVDVLILNEEVEDDFITIATKNGLVKKTVGKEYKTSVSSLKAINLEDDDEVIGVQVTDGKQKLLLGTKEGYTIYFAEEEISPTGRNTKGRKGINLEDNDEVINLNVTNKEEVVISLTENGRGKASPITDYNLQQRNGKGLKTMSNDDYQLLNIISANVNEKIILVTDKGQVIEKNVSDITTTERLGNMYSQINLKDEKLVQIIKLPLS
ncbi:DNA gyrase, A subunit [Halobacteroides halobius DSM 5150]|uniref:DNA topoisomerase (ATP-hydrolyzing) n=1 Tax=Halobacteroides halobius (strain ATCC 35273 / DSM 5150 / MD-1) TaxID=748449 RepID=L0KA32_HALHC|nr:DNA gyrase subunit A [Halobacteroides halobius]AGB40963.1 DNA gyrase, A subunit [Halobacteroides halobius DSM 5150]